MGRFDDTLALLRDGGFRRLYAGRLVSLVGDQLYTVAAMWLVFSLTGSTTYTGLAGFLSRAPGAVRVLVGPVVDRSRLDRLLVASELAQSAFVLVVPVAAATGHLSVGVVLGVMPLVALAGVFAGPAQSAALPRLVDEALLVRANTLTSVGSRAIRTGGQAVAGALVAAVGAVRMYVVDVATFALASAIFLRLRLPERDRGASDEPFDRRAYVADLREGGRVLTRSVLGQVLVAALLANALAGLRSAVLPAFADGLGGAAVYGLLLASLSAGAVVGAVAASALETIPFGRVTRVGFLASGLCIAGGVLAESTTSTAVLFFLGTVPVGAYNVLVQAAVQTGVPDGLLGRVTAALGSATAVVGPLGTLLGGVLGDLVGSRAVLLASAGGYVLAAVYWALVPALRRFPPIRSLEPGRFAPG